MTKTLYRKSGYAIPKIGVRYTENRGTVLLKTLMKTRCISDLKKQIIKTHSFIDMF